MTKEELENRVAELEAELVSKNELIESLKETVASFEQSGAKNRTVKGTITIDKVKYGFVDGYVKTRLANGELISSEEALKDKELMAHLVKIGYAGVERK